MAVEPRHVAREKFTQDSRVILLEQDMDHFERSVHEIKRLLWAAIFAGFSATIAFTLNLLDGRLG